jgi:transcriptional regulator with XRE-family HTH domain
MTQEKLANLAGVHPVVISKLVNNHFKKNKPYLLEKIAKILEISVDEFYL